MNLTTKQKKALKHLKIRPFDKDLRRFTLKEIKREFSAKTSGRILMAPLIRNIVVPGRQLDERGQETQGRGQPPLFFLPVD